MKIAVISAQVFACPPPGYSGLEMIAWQQARCLALRGHQVILFAPNGSSCPGCQVVHTGEPGWDEKVAYGGDGKPGGWGGYWSLLPQFEAIIDNSIAGGEKLLVRIDGKSRWLTIAELYAWAESKFPAILENGSVECHVTGLEVPSATDIDKIEWKRVSAVIRHRRKEAIHSVKMRGGSTVNATAGHSVIVAGRRCLDVARADECVGRHAAVARHIPAAELDAQFWPVGVSALNGFSISGSRVSAIVEESRQKLLAVVASRGGKHDTAWSAMSNWKRRGILIDLLPEVPSEFDISVYGKRKVNWPIRLGDDDLILMGLWVGDGCYGPVTVRLASGTETETVSANVADRFGANVTRPTVRPDVSHQINSKLLKTMMCAAGLNGYSHTKIVPDWIFGLSRRQIGLFLRGYFSADGHCNKRLCANSVNENLIRQVSVLLAMCGIQSRVSMSAMSGFNNIGGSIWEVAIPTDEWRHFQQHIGFVQRKKNDNLANGVMTRRSWRGDVPYCLVREKKLRTGTKEEVLSITQLALKKGEAVAERFADSDISWRKIVSSEPTELTDEYVYDLSVPGSENFFVGTTCCHNSWQKNSYLLKMEGRLPAPVLGVCHAPVDTMFKELPLEKPCFVCISEDQGSHFRGLFNKDCRVAYNGICTQTYAPMGLPRSDRFLFLARFSSVKSPELCQNVCLEAGVGLDMVGDVLLTNEPDLLERCKRRADGNRIRLIGPASRGECVWWFSQARALIHLTPTFREPYGLAPVEAQACGCPVLAWRIGAMSETVKHGETGFLVSSKEEAVEILKSGALDSIDRNKCREWALQFSVERMASRYEQLAVEALAGGW